MSARPATFDEVVAALAGVWSGPGTGEYPTIETFGYVETITFTVVPGKPFLAYGQRTVHADDGRPLHSETGYLRVPEVGRVELVLAHPTGVVEIEEGTAFLTGGVLDLDLASTGVALTRTAKEVSALARAVVVDPAADSLRYNLAMAAVGLGLTHHLTASLTRQTS